MWCLIMELSISVFINPLTGIHVQKMNMFTNNSVFICRYVRLYKLIYSISSRFYNDFETSDSLNILLYPSHQGFRTSQIYKPFLYKVHLQALYSVKGNQHILYKCLQG